jgi:hypothetical protein
MAVLTTGGTYTYQPTAVQLVTAALRACQVIGEEDTASGVQLQTGLDALNLLAKNIQASGAHLWLQEEAILFLQPSQAQYQLGVGSPDFAVPFQQLVQTTLSAPASTSATTISVASAHGIVSGDNIGILLTTGRLFWTTVNGTPVGTTVTLTTGLPSGAPSGASVFDFTVGLSRPLKVIGARAYTASTGAETPLLPMSRLDYANLSGKVTPTAAPSQYFFDPQTGQGSYGEQFSLMNLYNAPTDSTIVIRFTAQRQIQDFANLSNFPDFPLEWGAALKWLLALELAPEYGVPPELFTVIKQLADPKMAMLQQWDQEQAGTTTFPFSQTVYQLIAGALRLCGGSGPQDIPTLGQIENGLYTLNAMVQAWQALGMHVWTQETITFTPTIGKATYTIGTSGSPDVNQTRPLRVTGARLVDSTTQAATPLIMMTRQDYANLSDKTLPTGPIMQFFYDPQIPNGILSVWPAPAVTTSVVNLTAQRPLTPFANLSATADFPVEWLSALRYGLAVELGPEYKCDPNQLVALKTLADEKLKVASEWDQEQQGTTAFPFTQAVYQIIARALRLCNACGPQENPSYGMVQNAFTSLNAMVQGWQASGIHLWCEEEAILYLQPNQQLYQIGIASPDHATLYNSAVQTSLAASALAGATMLSLASAAGINAGDNIGIQLDMGTNFWTTVSGPPSGNTVTIAAPLPSQASALAVVVDYTSPLIRPLRLYTGRRFTYNGKLEVPMITLSRTDWANLPNKYNTGMITQYYFDPQLGLALLNFWPTPQDNTIAFRFTAQRPLTTFADLASTADFPDEWINALVYNLAADMWPEYNSGAPASPIKKNGNGGGGYGFTRAQEFMGLRALAAEKLQMAQAWDREPQSILFGMAFQPGYHNG